MDVTRVEFDALATRVAALEGAVPPTVGPPTLPTPITTIVLGAPAVTLTGERYTISARVSTTAVTTFKYLQLAVRGPGATDLARKPNHTMGIGVTTTLEGVGSGLNGEFTTYLAYSLDGTTWVDGPKTSFTISGLVEPPVRVPAPGDGTNTLMGKSGLSFNSLVFRNSPAQAEEFGRRRGVPVDGMLTFASRQSWGDFKRVPEGTAAYLASGHLVVNSMPHAPESEGNAMNERGANDAYKNQQRDLGKHLKDAGLNVPEYVVRVDWESNGNWYRWSANRGGAAALRQSIINYVTNLRAGGATKVRFDLCWNKGPSQSGADFSVFPGAEYIDVVGIDQYDMWGPSYTEADWEREMSSAKSPTVRTVAAFASKHGILWSWDEGGNTHGSRNQGGDNPFYWRMRRKEIERHLINCAWDTTYDHPGAPASLAHDFAQNPKSWPVYKELWTP